MRKAKREALMAKREARKEKRKAWKEKKRDWIAKRKAWKKISLDEKIDSRYHSEIPTYAVATILFILQLLFIFSAFDNSRNIALLIRRSMF